MKIIRTKEQYEKQKSKIQKLIQKAEEATKDCYTCPYCKSDDGVTHYSTRYDSILFLPKKIDIFECTLCGTRWESKPYKDWRCYYD